MAKECGEMFLDSFLEPAKEKEYTKISIVDLTERCSASRQAFYYHYKSIGDMVIKNVNKEIGNKHSKQNRRKNYKINELNTVSKRYFSFILLFADDKNALKLMLQGVFQRIIKSYQRPERGRR